MWTFSKQSPKIDSNINPKTSDLLRGILTLHSLVSLLEPTDRLWQEVEAVGSMCSHLLQSRLRAACLCMTWSITVFSKVPFCWIIFAWSKWLLKVWGHAVMGHIPEEDNLYLSTWLVTLNEWWLSLGILLFRIKPRKGGTHRVCRLNCFGPEQKYIYICIC